MTLCVDTSTHWFDVEQARSYPNMKEYRLVCESRSEKKKEEGKGTATMTF